MYKLDVAFKEMDKNEDGVVSLDEYMTWYVRVGFDLFTQYKKKAIQPKPTQTHPTHPFLSPRHRMTHPCSPDDVIGISARYA